VAAGRLRGEAGSSPGGPGHAGTARGGDDPPIRVFLVDDQTLVRQGLASLLGLLPDLRVVGQADGGEAAVARIPAVAPDVVLLDLRMPDLDGLEVLAALAAAGTLPPTLVLTTFDEDALLLEAVRRGARGFLLKDVTLERLAAAIRNVAAGTLSLEEISLLLGFSEAAAFRRAFKRWTGQTPTQFRRASG